MILVLSIILFLLLLIFNRERGVKAFCCLFLNFIMIVAAVFLISWGVDAILLAFLFSLGSSAFILFYINGFNIKTKVAYLSVAAVLSITTALIVFVGFNGGIGGFDAFYRDEIFFVCPIDVNIDYTRVAIAVVIMSLTGVITDMAIDVTTSLYEVFQNNKQLTFAELVQSGQRIGSDVLGTMINTLFFVFVGEFTGFFILYCRQGFGTIVNHKLFLQEMSKLLIGNLGCLLIIPVAILLQSYLYSRSPSA